MLIVYERQSGVLLREHSEHQPLQNGLEISILLKQGSEFLAHLVGERDEKHLRDQVKKRSG